MRNLCTTPAKFCLTITLLSITLMAATACSSSPAQQPAARAEPTAVLLNESEVQEDTPQSESVPDLPRSAFSTPQKWTDQGVFCEQGCYLADVNGDGAADFVVQDNDGIYVLVAQ